MSNRAKIFLPFAALGGLEEALREKELEVERGHTRALFTISVGMSVRVETRDGQLVTGKIRRIKDGQVTIGQKSLSLALIKQILPSEIEGD